MKNETFAKLAALKMDLEKSNPNHAVEKNNNYQKTESIKQVKQHQSKQERVSTKASTVVTPPPTNIVQTPKIEKGNHNEQKKYAIDPNQTYLAYDFIEINPSKVMYSHSERGNLTGEMIVSLDVVSPLAIVNAFREVRENVKNKIPASSLKGMIRSAAEIIWDEVITVTKETDERLVGNLKMKDTTVLNHRLATHLFGLVQTHNKRVKEANAFSSKLRFTDAKATKVAQETEVILKDHALSTPNGLVNTKNKNLLNPAYLSDDRKTVAGRKVYLAGRMSDKSPTLFASRVAPELKRYVRETVQGKGKEKLKLIHPGANYEFKIYFNELTEFELASVIRVIELNGEATHGLGKGKPLGLGRVKLQVKSISLQDKEHFFDLNKPTLSKKLDKEQLLKAEPNKFEEKQKQFEVLSTISNFDEKKAYLPPKNIGPNGKRIVAQYSKITNGR